jgi:ech hydrogenase subunit A
MIHVELLLFLIIFPFLIALILAGVRGARIREVIVLFGAGLIILVSIVLLLMGYSDLATIFPIGSEITALIMFGAEIAIALYILYIGAKYRKYAVIALTLLQAALLIIVEYAAVGWHEINENLFIDQFSIIMAAIVGVIGSLIAIYAISYMRDYHTHHPDVIDRSPFFFATTFMFLAAMFGLVFSNNLLWVFFFWEITTLCSFLLIGYSGSEEAVNNAFWALLINVAGGVAFIGGIFYILVALPADHVLITNLMHAGPLALLPAALISIAGLTKSAQMPFSSWLVGAMVAPTPVSALLHSSTMVKAGVYIIVRFAPVFDGQLIGVLIALIGGITFLLASCIAINMSNTKKILAYSTIANLGLVVACAGIGTPDAVWAAILLIIFHAVAKSLLFLSVGTVSHRIDSLDIEDMSGLITTMPRVGMMMLIGIAGMFLAPFGMLISKWASLHAFVSASPPFGIILVLIIAYGSAVTAFFWTKWMGKIIQATYHGAKNEQDIQVHEWTVLHAITALTIIICLLFPFISWYMIEPYLSGYYPSVSNLISLSNVEIMTMMLFLVLMMPFSLSYFKRTRTTIPRYMGGLPSKDGLSYTGSLGTVRNVTLSNYYLSSYFEEKRLAHYGVYITGLLLVILIALVEGGL